MIKTKHKGSSRVEGEMKGKRCFILMAYWERKKGVKFIKKGLARCALSPLCGSSKSGCTAVGINNAEGCCVSDRVGTEHEKGGV